MTTVVFKIAFWSLFTVVQILSIVPPSGRPVVAASWIEHAAAFFVLGWLLGTAHDLKPFTGIALGALIAISTELMQFFAEGRHPRISDLVVDSVGTVAGFLLALALRAALRCMGRGES